MSAQVLKSMNKRSVGFFFAFFIITIIQLIRAFYGIEITDEAYYLAEAKTVLEGNVPYAYNNSSVVGQTFLMIPFTFIYRILVPSYEGFFLYMRICFIAFKSAILLCSYYVLKKRRDGIFTDGAILCMNSVHFYSLQNFSYNTIPFYLVFFVGTLLYSLQEQDSNRRTYITYFLAGMLSSIFVFAHPARTINVCLFCILLLLYRVEWKRIGMYLLGGIFHIAIFFSLIIYQTSFHQLYDGVLGCIDTLSNAASPSTDSSVTLIFMAFRNLWLAMIFVFAVTYAIITGEKLGKYLSVRDRDSFEKKSRVLFSICVALGVGFLYVLFRYDTASISWGIGACLLLAFIPIMICFPKEKTVWYIGFQGIGFALLEAFLLSSTSPTSRFSYAIPAIVVLLILWEEMLWKTEKSTSKEMSKDVTTLSAVHYSCNLQRILRYMTAIVLTVLIIFCELKGLRYVYRDQPLDELDYKVGSGIYKGIYTSSQNARDTIELERYIRDSTSEEEYVAFRDNVPVGYLFMNGKICDIRTWDCMQYSYGKNNPTKLYAYYEKRKLIPDKIIYVDYGRDEWLSMYDENYLYNQFINDNYYKVLDEELNDTYKEVIIFERKTNKKPKGRR